ncbi:MAG: inositol monophosphatase family protein [Thermoanaerobaculia bacterium]
MLSELLQVAVEAARAGGEELRRRFRSGDLQVAEKAQNDLVTEADRASEEAILACLRRHRPGDGILAEESGWSAGDGEGYRWVVDPLDGTANFARGLPIFAVAVACMRDSELLVGVVLDPVGENLFTAARGEGAAWNGMLIRVSARPDLAGAFLATGFPFRAREALDLYQQCFARLFLEAGGIRRCGSAALDLAYTAAGVFDGFFEFRLSPWDIAAGELLIREAGGVVTDLDGGDRQLATGNVLAGSPRVHAAMRGVLSGLASEAQVAALTPEPGAVTAERASGRQAAWSREATGGRVP